MSPSLRNTRRSGGFTLLEVLLAVSITAVVVVIVFGAFRIGIRAWEKGERYTEKQQRIRVVAQLIKAQLGSLISSKTMTKTGRSVVFEGEEGRMSFFSTLALNPAHGGAVVFSQLAVESDAEGTDLFFVEKGLTPGQEAIDPDAIDDGDRRPLLSELSAIRFRYLQGVDAQGGWDWTNRWDPADGRSLPLAVEVQISDEAFAAPITVLIPLRGRGLA